MVVIWRWWSSGDGGHLAMVIWRWSSGDGGHLAMVVIWRFLSYWDWPGL